MDGTLVDTEPYWIDREFALAEKYGGTWTQEHAMVVVGGDLIESATYMRAHMGIDRTPRPDRRGAARRGGGDGGAEGAVAPGRARPAGAAARGRDPCVLVTMSWRRFVDPVVEALPPGSFDAVVTGDEVSRGKPHPEPYLAGAELVGCRPEHTLAIEDSPTGAASAGRRWLPGPGRAAPRPGSPRPAAGRAQHAGRSRYRGAVAALRGRRRRLLRGPSTHVQWPRPSRHGTLLA